MKIIKRDGKEEQFAPQKIRNAIAKAFAEGDSPASEAVLDALADSVISKLTGAVTAVETVQDLAEKAMMEAGYFEEAKRFILYRDARAKKRAVRNELAALFPDRQLGELFKGMQADFPEEEYDLGKLLHKYRSFLSEAMDDAARYGALVRAAVELTTQEAPKWEFLSARLVMHDMYARLAQEEAKRKISGCTALISPNTIPGRNAPPARRSSTANGTSCSPTPPSSWCSSATSYTITTALCSRRRRRCFWASRCTSPCRKRTSCSG